MQGGAAFVGREHRHDDPGQVFGPRTGGGRQAFEVHSDGIRSTGRNRGALPNAGEHRRLDKGHHARAGLDHVGHLQRGRESGLRDQESGTRGTIEEHAVSEISEGCVRDQRRGHTEFARERVTRSQSASKLDQDEIRELIELNHSRVDGSRALRSKEMIFPFLSIGDIYSIFYYKKIRRLLLEDTAFDY